MQPRLPKFVRYHRHISLPMLNQAGQREQHPCNFEKILRHASDEQTLAGFAIAPVDLLHFVGAGEPFKNLRVSNPNLYSRIGNSHDHQFQRAEACSDSRTDGSLNRNSAANEKIVVLTPMPRASEMTAVIANQRSRWSARRAYCKSRTKSSSHPNCHASRDSSPIARLDQTPAALAP